MAATAATRLMAHNLIIVTRRMAMMGSCMMVAVRSHPSLVRQRCRLLENGNETARARRHPQIGTNRP